MSLATAIDELIAHVPNSRDDTIPGETAWWGRFQELSIAVWVEACRLGYERHLPPKKDDISDFCTYVGKTNLYGIDLEDGGLIPIGLHPWKDALLALRALAESAATETVTESPPPRLTVDFPSKKIHFDGTAYDCRSERALRWVKILAERSPAWVSSADLQSIDTELCTTRTDKLKKLLPPEISNLIDSQTGAGSRLLFDGRK